MTAKLNRIKEYFNSMELIDGKWVICVRYKEKWGAYPSEDGSINAVPDEKVANVYWYYATTDKVDIDDIVTLIEETVQTNLDAMKKAELFKEKAIELKSLFSDVNIPYVKLKTLKFVFDEDNHEPVVKQKKVAKKTKPKTKKDIMSQAVEEAEDSEMTVEQTNCKVDVATIKDTRDYSTVTTSVMNATDMSQDEIDDLRG